MDWFDIETALEAATAETGVYYFGWERPDGTILTIYIGRGFGARGIRKRVLDHINGTSAGSSCLNQVVAHGGDRVLVRWEESADEDDEGRAFDEFEADWGEGLRPPCVRRRALARLPNPRWPASWLDTWPEDEG